MKFKVVSIFTLLVLIFPSCKVPTESEAPKPLQFRAKIEVIYERDVSRIIFPEGNDDFVTIHYELFDPERQIRKEGERILGYYRIGDFKVEKISENKFRTYLENVFVQSEPWHGKHKVCIRDPKFYDGVSDISVETPYGINIQDAYDIEIQFPMLLFKMSASK